MDVFCCPICRLMGADFGLHDVIFKSNRILLDTWPVSQLLLFILTSQNNVPVR